MKQGKNGNSTHSGRQKNETFLTAEIFYLHTKKGIKNDITAMNAYSDLYMTDIEEIESG